MMGEQKSEPELFNYAVNLEKRVRSNHPLSNHPLRRVKGAIANLDILKLEDGLSSMARSVRVEFPGAFYHVMARGNRREAIFLDQEDAKQFVKALGEVCAMTGWRVHAWVLLSNHYHLMIETPEANLVAGMKWLQNTLTRRFNVRHRAWGRVFGDRYKAVVVEGGQRFYYETLMDYIHLNPMRAGLVRVGKGESILNYPWSSMATGYGVPANKRAKW